MSQVFRLFLSLLFVVLIVAPTSSCKRRGCRSNVACVDNYDSRAKRDGDCDGCINFAAHNYCPEATEDNGTCVFERKFYSENGADGWIDIWVSDSVDNSNPNLLRYEGRLTNFPVFIPECDQSDSTMQILRQPGEYYYEIETQTGILSWGWVVYREEGCRLLDVY